MDEDTRRALETDRLIDITTTGRRSGQPRRIEVGFFYIDDRLFITGRPGRRGWYANLLANPTLTIHLKQSLQRDIAARATPIRDEEQRRLVFAQMRERVAGRFNLDVDAWTASSPLVEVELVDT